MTGLLRRLSRVVLLIACASTASAADIPYLTGRVVDDAGVMSEAVRSRLTERLKAHEAATTNQVVVLTVPTIGSESIEDYAVQVFQNWKLGQKGRDNGVLVVVVPQDRKMRIEVGYGLEPVLTDGACGQIIRSVMTPQFKAGNYDGGIEAGIAAILARLEGHEAPPTERAPAARAPAVRITSGTPDWAMKILLGAFVFGIIGLFTVLGVMTPGMGWFLYVFLIPFWAMFPIAIIGPQPTLALLAAYVIGYPIAKLRVARTEWYRKAAQDLKSTGHANIGGFTFTSGGSSSGFSSGGGFSGGGGSSGGGGASGSW